MTGHGIQYLIFAWTPSSVEYVRKASVGHFEQGKQQCLRFWGCTPPLHTCLRMSKFWALCWCLRFFNRSWIPWLNPLQSLHVSFIHVDFCWTKTWRLTGTTDKRTWGLQKVRLGLSPGQIDHCILRVSGSIHLYTSSKSCKPGSIQRLTSSSWQLCSLSCVPSWPILYYLVPALPLVLSRDIECGG